MKRNPLRRKLDRLAGRFFLFFTFTVIKAIPRRFFYRFSIGLGTLAYYLARKHRKLALSNLKRAFGDSKDETEYAKITKDVFRSISLNGCETAMMALHKGSEEIKKEIKIDGFENLERVLREGKGAIALSAHFGNFTLMCARLSQENFSFKPVIKDPDDKVIAEFFGKLMERANVRYISAKPRHECVRNSIEHLRQNGVLCLLADQSKNKGVIVEFFGHQSGTVAGPAVMSLRTNAPIVPVFIIREGKLNNRITVHPPLEVSLSGDYDKDVFEITQKFTAIIENYARRYPEQWWWVHQRWKHAPR